MSQLLKGQTAIVTGGTAGIGAAIAKCFVEQGAYVAFFGTNQERGSLVEQELRLIPNSPGADFYQVNVAIGSEVNQAITKVLEQRGKVDVLVNNAGITSDRLLMRMTEEDWDNVMDINVKSCYHTCHALVRSFLKAKKGRIINISSVVGIMGNAGQANYAASKAAVIGFTKALARELASRNILVNCVAPGYISTPMTDALTAEQKEATIKQVPLGRMGSPNDIAQAVLFLASEMSCYITGQTIVVDGGMAI